jgi:DNA-binding MarR family transcriptional regulator
MAIGKPIVDLMPEISPPDRDIAGLMKVLTEIGIIHQLSNAAMRKVLAPHLNPSEFALLQHFGARGDGQTPTDLARVMQVTKPSMTAMLAKLARKEFVTMSADANDARRLRVHCTDAGRAAHRDAASKLGATAAAATHGLDHETLIAITPVLVSLREAFDRARD